MPEDLETRTVMTPRTGTKICILIGLAFIVAAVYFYFVPVTGVRTDSGSVFGCGSAANAPSSTFAKGTCYRVTDVEKYRAIAAAAIGILTIALGAVMFGVDRRTETRRVRHTDGNADDRPRSGDRPRWNDDLRNRHADGHEQSDRDGNDRELSRDSDDRGGDGRDRARSERIPDDGFDDLAREGTDARRERRRPRSDWDD